MNRSFEIAANVPPARAYSQMLDDIAQALASGELAGGARLPTEGQMCARYDISVSSVRRGIDWLVREGVVFRRQGSGTYVCDDWAPEPITVNAVMLALDGTLACDAAALRARLVALGYTPSDVNLDEAVALEDARAAATARIRSIRGAAGILASPRFADHLLGQGGTRLPLVCCGPHARLPFVAVDWMYELGRAIATVHRAGATQIAVVGADQPSEIRALVAGLGLPELPLTIHHCQAQGTTSSAIHEAYSIGVQLAAGQQNGVVIADGVVAQGVLDALVEAGANVDYPVACLLKERQQLRSSIPVMRLLANGQRVATAAAELIHQWISMPQDAAQELVASCDWHHDQGAVRPRLVG